MSKDNVQVLNDARMSVVRVIFNFVWLFILGCLAFLPLLVISSLAEAQEAFTKGYFFGLSHFMVLILMCSILAVVLEIVVYGLVGEQGTLKGHAARIATLACTVLQYRSSFSSSSTSANPPPPPWKLQMI